MSGKATGWVFENGPKPGDLDEAGEEIGLAKARGLRAILLAVADAANADGEHSHPGRRLLAEHSLYSIGHVDKALGELVRLGWLEVEKTGGGRGQATTYRLPKMKKPPTGEEVSDEDVSRKPPTSDPETSSYPEKPPTRPTAEQGSSSPNGLFNGKPSTAGQKLRQAALLLAEQEAEERSDQIRDRGAYVRARQRDILQEHESLWNLWLEDSPDASPADLVEAARPVGRARPTPLDSTVAAQRQRLKDWTGTGRGEDRNPAYLPDDDHD